MVLGEKKERDAAEWKIPITNLGNSYFLRLNTFRSRLEQHNKEI